MFARSILTVSAMLVLMLCQISLADPGDGNGPEQRPFAHRPMPPQMDGNRDMRNNDDEAATLAQLQQQISQLSKQVAKLQKTLDDQAKQSTQNRNRDFSQQDDSRQEQNWSRTPGWQERGEFPQRRMPRPPGMMGQREMMQRSGPGVEGFGPGPMEHRGMMNQDGPMDPQGPMPRQGPMEERARMDDSAPMDRQRPWDSREQMGDRGMMGRGDPMEGPMDGSMNDRGTPGGWSQRDPQGPMDQPVGPGQAGPRDRMGGPGQMDQQDPRDDQQNNPPRPQQGRQHRGPQGYSQGNNFGPGTAWN